MIRKMLVMWVLMVVVGAGPTFAETYLIYNNYGGTWSDANKTYEDDSNMCWAGSIANVLEYGAWGVGAYPNAPAIFSHFKAAWPNVGGLPQEGFSWWLNGVSMPGGILVPGGNYWPTYNYSNFYNSIFPTPEYIDTSLRSGKIVTLGITGFLGGHALTCWGLGYQRLTNSELGEERRIYNSLFVTDSSDSETALVEMPISYNADQGRWELTGGLWSGWSLTAAEEFEMRPYLVHWDYDRRIIDRLVMLDPLYAVKDVFKLDPFLTFDYRWDGPMPQDGTENALFTIKALTDDGEWVLLFQDLYDPQELGVWNSLNLLIPQELLGYRTLLFEMEGNGQVSFYRLEFAPLPASLMLLASGLAGLLAWRRLSS
jgi:hypothetical protein